MATSQNPIESLEARALFSTALPGPEFDVGGPGDFWGAGGRTVASDGNGNFVVAVSDGFGSNCDVHVRVFDGAGVPKTGWVLADAPDDLKTKFVPNVAMGANGNFVVTWWQTDNFVGGRLFNAAAQPIGPIFTVQKASSTAASHPTPAMDDAGNFVVAWNATQGGQGDEVYAQRYNAAGAAQGKKLTVNTYSSRGQHDPSVDVDADGDFLVAWTSQAQDGSGDGVYAQRYRRDGAKQGGEFRVNTTTAGGQSGASVALDAAGDAVVVWQGPAADGTGAAWGQRYTAAGAPAGGEFRVDDPADGGGAAPVVDAGRDGGFVVGWSHFVRAYDPAGQPLTGSVAIASGGPAGAPQVAALAGGGFVSVWARGTPAELFGEVFILA